MSEVYVTGLNELLKDMDGVVDKYNGKVTKMLRSEGTKLKKCVKNTAGTKIKRRTGNYLKGVTVQRPYQYNRSNGTKNKDSVKVYGKHGIGLANHAHLIEDRHEKWLWGNRTAERVREFYVYRDAGKEYQPKFEENCEKFVTELLASLTV